MFGRPANGGGSGRPICKFFLEGRCKFGENCKNEHPRGQGTQQQSNRFAPLQNSGNTTFRDRQGAAARDQSTNPFLISEDVIRDDLTIGKERPQWPLSAYGPGVRAPRQLLEGAIEVSPEEMRVLFYLAQASGNPREYVQHEERLTQQMSQQVQTILNDVSGAKRYIIDGQDQHPNRNDMLNDSTQTFPGQGALMAGPSNPATTVSSFGAPSNIAAAKSAFGTPSAMGQGSAFGAPSSLGQTSAFGKPATLGGGAGAFGRQSAFGQPATLGQTTSGFGSGQQMTGFTQTDRPSPFGQPSALAQPSSFGTQTQQTQPSTAFGKPTAFGAASQQPSPFAQANSSQVNGSPFAQSGLNRPASANPFGQATQQSPFQAPNAFAQAGQSQPQTQSPFTSSNTTAQQTAGFGAPTTNPGPLPAAPNNSSSVGFASPTNRQNYPVVTDQEGKSYYEIPAPTRANPANRRRERIWHPKGRPENINLDAEGPAEAYNGEAGDLLQEIYKAVRETGQFKEVGGLMPEVPPKRDWIDWNL